MKKIIAALNQIVCWIMHPAVLFAFSWLLLDLVYVRYFELGDSFCIESFAIGVLIVTWFLLVCSVLSKIFCLVDANKKSSDQEDTAE